MVEIIALKWYGRVRLRVDRNGFDYREEKKEGTKSQQQNTQFIQRLGKVCVGRKKKKKNSVGVMYGEWVQVGNETGNGMLWNDGKASENMAQYAALTTAGYDAVKTVYPDCQVVVHLQEGNLNSLYRWLFDGLKANGGKWDVIGMSLYPSADNWESLTSDMLANMEDLISRYGTPVMVCETGMPWDDAETAYAYPRPRFLGLLTANYIMFPLTLSILIFSTKMAVVYMYAKTTYFAPVPPILILANFLLSGYDLIVILLLNISVLFIPTPILSYSYSYSSLFLLLFFLIPTPILSYSYSYSS